jgi:hypothetical protein
MKHIEALEQIMEMPLKTDERETTATELAIGHKEETKTMLPKQMPTIVTYS